MTINILIVGLGYVGLPLMVALSKYFNTFGYDINQSRIKELKRSFDINNETKLSDLKRIRSRIHQNLSLFTPESIKLV